MKFISSSVYNMQLILHLVVLIFQFHNACFWASGAIECQSSSKVAYTITVSQSNDRNFSTINDAVNSIPSGNNQWVKILLKPGTYNEQVHIQPDKGCIVLEGSDRMTTIITSNAKYTTSTSDSFTFSVDSDNFVARGVTFENSYNKALNNITQNNPIAPAIALKSDGDKHAFYSCGFVGYQDTLLDSKGRHYFNSCYIEGAVDFVWGNGQSVYQFCTINVTGGGYITAQGRESANDPSGYVFRECGVLGTGQADLGRAYRAFSRVIFIDSIFSSVIYLEGWNIWDQTGHENDIIYAEVNCTGPGADTSKRVPWEKKLSSSEVEQYTTKAFIDQDGWIEKQPLRSNNG